MSAEIKNRPQDLWDIAPREHYPKERCPKGVRSKVGAEKDKIRLYGPKNFKIYEKISFIIK